jgi:hypothetical protein
MPVLRGMFQLKVSRASLCQARRRPKPAFRVDATARGHRGPSVPARPDTVALLNAWHTVADGTSSRAALRRSAGLGPLPDPWPKGNQLYSLVSMPASRPHDATCPDRFFTRGIATRTTDASTHRVHGGAPAPT